ncbi:B12-binding domain-containing radical SAM protein [Geomonas silvestris]|uniref:B12-binding domain-containing radical SAM protein n=1 Tax=Geomonas silvestris TaxID=2740184 RepID=A0A6V8MMV3_9BACT|nr:B12-binding domain-containing radical SAM protein [Geomonas silvestris]GFO61302.1 B12-binding domain-containing radical SAM protein [Geomonas silvestris]
MKILFATLHAKYVHSSLALPYLAAAVADLEGIESQILELTVNEQPDQLLARLFALDADALFFSCYIWNTELTLKLASDLKKLAPRTRIVLGGPEVSFGSFELMARNPAIDCIVRGEGEESCRELLSAWRDATSLEELAGITYRDGDEVIANPERAALAELDSIPSPFAAGLVDLEKPLTYYETSRGCPFSCAFCLSSVERGVRSFSAERIERDLEILIAAGARTVKLVDRTFNYDARRADRIWRLILEKNSSATFHFEIAAELLTDENLALLAQVPPGQFRFEIGVQSAGEATLAQVERNMSLAKLNERVARLIRETSVTVHLDLVAGLPGEGFPGFLGSLQGLFDLAPDHIQVEPLKVLKGTAMRGIARKEGYAYAEAAPYKILSTPWLDFWEIRRIETVSRLVEQYYNSGRFVASLAVLAEKAPLSQVLAEAAVWFEAQGVAGQLSLAVLFEKLWEFAGERLAGGERERLRDALCFDYCKVGYPGGARPAFLTLQEEPAGAPPRLCKGGKDERVRYYRRSFARDYRNNPWQEGAVVLTFWYRSAPGAGLSVEVIGEDVS